MPINTLWAPEAPNGEEWDVLNGAIIDDTPTDIDSPMIPSMNESTMITVGFSFAEYTSSTDQQSKHK
ncbi:MAG: hypothetical protein GOMPHAMPRED_008300 [Gomphillus americanus]|uniref:Uncharacterized protein n=1 Tax=Gomphillus americanus TaxID=1940652 RepID=A0A8H3IDU8_9LECA|nr:MAG: hypothetical protein GOMPHAMPRED_008300 [Gomphillus americanus]